MLATKARFLYAVGRALFKASVKQGGKMVAEWLQLDHAYEWAQDAIQIYRDDAQDQRDELDDAEEAAIRREIQDIAQAPPERHAQDVAHAIAQIAAAESAACGLAFALPPETQQTLARALLQLPAAIHRTLSRPEDPRGRTTPLHLPLRTAADLAPFLEIAVPRFEPGHIPYPHSDLKLLRLLGIGGFGEVWLAEHQDRKRQPVALKFCTNERARKNLVKEVHLLDRLLDDQAHQDKYPGVVRLLHAHLRANPPSLEYEFVPGGELTHHLHALHAAGQGQADVLAVARLIRQLAGIVATMHRLNPPLVHRDLKPSNILLARRVGTAHQGPADAAGIDGAREIHGGQCPPYGDPVLKIADFGIAALAPAPAASNPHSLQASTQTRQSATRLYASPQQLAGRLAPHPADDVYALGVIWHQALTGNLHAPPPTGRAWKTLLRIRHMPAPLIDVLERCCDPEIADPEGRYPHAGALAAAIDAALPTSPFSRAPEARRREALDDQAPPIAPSRDLTGRGSAGANQPPRPVFVAFARSDQGSRRWIDQLSDAMGSIMPTEDVTFCDLESETYFPSVLAQAEQAQAIALMVGPGLIGHTLIRTGDLPGSIGKAVEGGARLVNLLVKPCELSSSALAFLVPNTGRTLSDMNVDQASTALVNAARKCGEAAMRPSSAPSRRPSYSNSLSAVATQPLPHGRGSDGAKPAALAPGPIELDLGVVGLFKLIFGGESVKLKAIWIPPGPFPAGSDTQLKVAPIDQGFHMGVTTVTQAQWQAVMGTTPWKGRNFVKEGPNIAATYVSWDDAQAFCQKVKTKTGAAARLPTEAEWEYACRAGTKTAYYFGDDEAKLGEHAWYGGIVGNGNCQAEQYAHEVGKKKSNPWGLCDMYGNVWEWCEDKCNESTHVLCGGSWYNIFSDCCSSNHYRCSPDLRGFNFGFRVVLESVAAGLR